MGVNLGILTGPHKVALSQPGGIIYATIGSILSSYLFPILDQNYSKQLQKTIFIIDEAHSNSVEQQILAGTIKYIISKKEEIFQNNILFIMQSASINIQEFKQFFNSKVSFEVKGINLPIVELYLNDLFTQQEQDQLTFSKYTTQIIKKIIQKSDQQIKDAISKSGCREDGDILIFTVGKRMIEDVVSEIQKITNIPIIVLSRENLDFRPDILEIVNNPKQKIIVSTNISETGVTFKHISFVIDCVKFKNVFYDPNRKIKVLRDLPICKNMMQQRKGRVGRITGGIYFPAITKQNKENLMNYREYLNQIQDIKSIVFQIGIKYFNKLQFMHSIPDELLLDAQQFDQIINFSNNITNELYQIFIKSFQKLNIYSRFLLYLGFVYGFRICQLISVVSFIESQEIRYDQKKKLTKRNDFLDIIKYIESSNISSLNGGFQKVFLELSTHFTQQNISIYKGNDVLENEPLFRLLISRVFQQFLMRKKLQDKGYALYETYYGLQVKIYQDTDEFPDVLITNEFMDVGFIMPVLVMDCQKSCADYTNICKNLKERY